MRAWEFINRAGQIVPCAWCQKEQQVTPAPDESHGICPRHNRQMLASVGLALRRDSNNTATVVPLRHVESEAA